MGAKKSVKVLVVGNPANTNALIITHCTIRGQSAVIKINDEGWIKENLVPTVQSRGAAVIAARKLSSAMSAAKAACDHMRSWWIGTQPGDWVSMAVFSDGSYGPPKGVMFSFPVTCSGGKWNIVKDLSMSEYSMSKLAASGSELCEERDEALAVCRN